MQEVRGLCSLLPYGKANQLPITQQVLGVDDTGMPLSQLALHYAANPGPQQEETGGPLPRELTSLIKQCGSVAELQELTNQHIGCMNSINISAAMVRLRNLWLGGPNHPLPGVHALEEQLCARAVALISPEFGPRELCNIMHAIGRLPFNPAVAAYVDQFLAAAQPQLPSFNPHDLANMASALAKLHLIRPAFMDALLAAAQPQLPSFNLQNLASTVWALGKLSHRRPAFMDALLSAAQPLLPSFNPQNLTKTVWALSELGHHHPAFMDALLSAAQPQLPSFNPQDLASTVWALGKLDHHHPAFMGTLLAAAQPQLPSFTPQSLANMAWALEKLGHSHPAFIPR